MYISNTIIAFGESELPAVECNGTVPVLSCCDIYGNAGGDWAGEIAPQLGINGNISLDPQFCDTAAGDFQIQGNSPCAEENNSCEVLIGALSVGCEPVYICGDANDDDAVNILDITHLINYLYKGGPPPVPPEAADINSDSAVNILDITYLINYLYEGGPEPNCS